MALPTEVERQGLCQAHLGLGDAGFHAECQAVPRSTSEKPSPSVFTWALGATDTAHRLLETSGLEEMFPQ